MKNSIILIILVTVSFLSQAQAQTQNLNYFIEKAVEQSPLVLKQNNINQIIDLDLKRLNAIYNAPKINLNSNVIFAPIISKDGNTNNFDLVSQGSNDYIGYDLGASNGGQYQALVSISQPLFTRKSYTSQQEKATLNKSKNKNKLALSKAELIQVITHQYVLCLQAQTQQQNAQETIDILTTQLKQMHVFVQSGIYKLTDLKLLEIELQNSEIAYQRLKTEYLTNFNALNLLAGIKDETIYQLEEMHQYIQPISDRTSVFLRQFSLDSLSIATDEKISELKYLPRVNAFGDAGLNATYLPTFNRLGFSVGISLNWNLFDGHQKQLKKKQNKLALENIKTDKVYFSQQNNIRKNNLLSQLKSLENQIVLLNDQLKKYNELLDLYKIEIKHSLISVLELKTLIKEINAKKQEKTSALMSKEIIINAYNYWNN